MATKVKNPKKRDPSVGSKTGERTDDLVLPWLAGRGALENLLAEQRDNVETLRQWNEIFIDATEALAARQLDAIKAVTDQFANGAGSALGARAPEEWGAAQADYARAWMDTWFALAKAALETGVRCSKDSAELICSRCAKSASQLRQGAGDVRRPR